MDFQPFLYLENKAGSVIYLSGEHTGSAWRRWIWPFLHHWSNRNLFVPLRKTFAATFLADSWVSLRGQSPHKDLFTPLPTNPPGSIYSVATETRKKHSVRGSKEDSLNIHSILANAVMLIGNPSLTGNIRLLLNSTVSYWGSQNTTNTNSSVFPCKKVISMLR